MPYLTNRRVRVRQLASIAGQLQSFELAAGGICRPYMRYFQAMSDDAGSRWGSVSLTTSDARDELIFWVIAECESFQGSILRPADCGEAFAVACDASIGEEGGGGKGLLATRPLDCARLLIYAEQADKILHPSGAARTDVFPSRTRVSLFGHKDGGLGRQ